MSTQYNSQLELEAIASLNSSPISSYADIKVKNIRNPKDEATFNKK
jgi:hypothetical protein